MAVNDDITLSKGAYSVTLFTKTSAENFKNTLTIIPGVVTPDNQATGVKDPTVVDLLRITHTLTFEAFITKTETKSAKQVKDDLVNIFNSGGVNSSPVTLSYEDDTFNVFIEDLVIKKINNDNVVATSYTANDAAEYNVTITVVEGKLVGT